MVIIHKEGPLCLLSLSLSRPLDPQPLVVHQRHGGYSKPHLREDTIDRVALQAFVFPPTPLICLFTMPLQTSVEGESGGRRVG